MVYVGSIFRGVVELPLKAPLGGRNAGSTLVTAATVLVAGAAAAASGANRGKLAICTTAPKANAFSSLRRHPLNCRVGTLTAYPYCRDRQSSGRLNSITPLVQGSPMSFRHREVMVGSTRCFSILYASNIIGIRNRSA